MNETPELERNQPRHRCHRCGTKRCPDQGKRRLVYGCPDFTHLDPFEIKPQWEGKRRIRKPTTICITKANLNFVMHCILPTDRRRFQGYYTRGVAACMEHCFDIWDADKEYPIIPKTIYDAEENELLRKKVTFQPELMERLDKIVGQFAGTNHRTNRSCVINHCIKILRDQLGA